MLKPFNPPGMVQPASRYSQGVEVGANARWLHISGQIGVAPDGKVAKGLEAQFRQAFENIGTVLAAAGMAKTDLVKVTVFVTVPDLETVGIYRKARDAVDGRPCAGCDLSGGRRAGAQGLSG